jgi:hypothetical protein
MGWTGTGDTMKRGDLVRITDRYSEKIVGVGLFLGRGKIHTYNGDKSIYKFFCDGLTKIYDEYLLEFSVIQPPSIEDKSAVR